MSWRLPKAEPRKTKERNLAPEIPKDEINGVTGQYVWLRGRWRWCWYPKKQEEEK
jgi:hypothetical protein